MDAQKNDWRQEEDVCVDFLGFIPGCCVGTTFSKLKWKEIKGGHPMRVRCPDCKRRLMTFLRECHDPGCFHAYLPKHKKPVKKKKKTSRDTYIRK
jgi:hypothetical protein